MPTITHTDYLLQVSGTGLVAVPGVWVRLLNNSTATNYYSTAVTTSTGAFTHSAVPGDYSAFYGTAATVPGTPTLANAHWAVPVTAGDDAVLGSATLVVSSPYGAFLPGAPTIPTPAGITTGKIWDWGGGTWNALAGGLKGDVQNVTDGVMNGTTAVLTSASNKFASSDVGKSIYVAGAGAAGALLSTTVASYQSAGQVTLTAVSQTAVGAATVNWGTNDTAALAALIAIVLAKKGSSIDMPDGTYLLDSIVISVAGKSGVQLKGQSTTGCVLLASPTATNFLTIKGTGIGTESQYNSGENFTIDMQLMPNSSASRGMYTTRTWGGSWRNINVRNFPASAYSLYCDVGTYTTIFDNCDFGPLTGVIRLQGISLGDAVTTITFLGCSFAQCVADQAFRISHYGSIVQGTLTRFILSNILGWLNQGCDIEGGAGTYLSLGASVQHLWSYGNEFSGFSGTYLTGTMISGSLMDPYGGIDFQFTPPGAGFTVNAVLTEASSAAALFRKLITNTNGVAQQVDIDIHNFAGDSYFGMSAAGDTTIDARGTGAVVLSQYGTTTFRARAADVQAYNTFIALKDFRRSRQTPTEAVLVSGVDAPTGEIISVTLTAARLVGAPLNPAIGQNLTFSFTQGGAGGFAVTWNAVFKKTWADTGNTTGKISAISFFYDGTNWIQTGAQSPYV